MTTKAELIAAVAHASGQSQYVTERVITSLGIFTQTTLKANGEVTLPGIGKLSVKAKPARTGRNPRTGAALEIAARNAPAFSAAKALKDAVN